MGVYLYPDNTETELKNAYIGQYPNVQTFDFQNDGDLNWTGMTIYGTPNYVSGEGWSIGSNSSTSYQSAIMPPLTVYNGETLKKWKLRVYKSDATVGGKCAGGGMGTNNFSGGLVCCHQTNTADYWANVYDGSSDHFTSVSDFTGEATLEYNLNDDGSLTLSINGGTEYNLGNFSNLFRNNWSNNDLGICIGRWTYSGTFYIRKVEIITV